MTPKLALCVVALGLVGSGLLSARQSRLQAGHEVTAARLRIRQHDERLLKMRAQIAEYVSPEAVRAMISVHDELGDLEPIAERVRTLPTGDPSAPEQEAGDAS